MAWISFRVWFQHSYCMNLMWIFHGRLYCHMHAMWVNENETGRTKVFRFSRVCVTSLVFILGFRFADSLCIGCMRIQEDVRIYIIIIWETSIITTALFLAVNPSWIYCHFVRLIKVHLMKFSVYSNLVSKFLKFLRCTIPSK